MNELKTESSPYLLQHANNPVDWKPWNSQTLEEAKNSKKPLLISIGYSSCHWCHVMEEESFTDKEVAKAMNDSFVCIKVDREERPDIDHYYMDAVQLLIGSGGWPLNCFALPDGTPFWGGTYFPKKQWLDILFQIKNVYKNRFYAVRNQSGILKEKIESLSTSLQAQANDKKVISKTQSKDIFGQIMQNFDYQNGGTKGAPKFPLPVIYDGLLSYYFHTKNNSALEHTTKSLTKMAYGGIYDHLGGGFCRYSTDNKWLAPHFEKMLYDNAQLTSIYAKAYKLTRNKLFKNVVIETLAFIKKKMTGKKGQFFSAIDADSEGEEGKFYVWKKKEIGDVLGNFSIEFADFYNVSEEGNWENRKNILHKTVSEEHFANDKGFDKKTFIDKLTKAKIALYNSREKRIHPAKDDKAITSWNALMSMGFIDAWEALGNRDYLDTAIKNINFILQNQVNDNGELLHSYRNNKAYNKGFLDDYAFLANALISLYENTFETYYIEKAKQLANKAIEQFYDGNALFYFSQQNNEPITRKKEIYDHVIPSSNSEMLIALHKLSFLFENREYLSIVKNGLSTLRQYIQKHPSSFMNWFKLQIFNTFPFYTLGIIGNKPQVAKQGLNKHFLPNVVICGNGGNKLIPILRHNQEKNGLQIYICDENSCKEPVNSIDSALKTIMRQGG